MKGCREYLRVFQVRNFLQFLACVQSLFLFIIFIFLIVKNSFESLPMEMV